MTDCVDPATGAKLHRDVRPLTLTYRGQSITVDMPGWYGDRPDEGVFDRPPGGHREAFGWRPQFRGVPRLLAPVRAWGMFQTCRAQTWTEALMKNHSTIYQFTVTSASQAPRLRISRASPPGTAPALRASSNGQSAAAFLASRNCQRTAGSAPAAPAPARSSTPVS